MRITKPGHRCRHRRWSAGGAQRHGAVLHAAAAGAPITVVANSVVRNFPAAGAVTVSFELSEPIGVGYGNNAVLDCVAFYEVNASGFNNDQSRAFQGDWKTTTSGMPPTNLVCRQPIGVAGAPPINVTTLTSLESNTPTTNPTIVPGFTSKPTSPLRWRRPT